MVAGVAEGRRQRWKERKERREQVDRDRRGNA
jgi:hypothetical protein